MQPLCPDAQSLAKQSELPVLKKCVIIHRFAGRVVSWMMRQRAAEACSAVMVR